MLSFIGVLIAIGVGAVFLLSLLSGVKKIFSSVSNSAAESNKMKRQDKFLALLSEIEALEEGITIFTVSEKRASLRNTFYRKTELGKFLSQSNVEKFKLESLFTQPYVDEAIQKGLNRSGIIVLPDLERLSSVSPPKQLLIVPSSNMEKELFVVRKRIDKVTKTVNEYKDNLSDEATIDMDVIELSEKKLAAFHEQEGTLLEEIIRMREHEMLDKGYEISEDAELALKTYHTLMED